MVCPICGGSELSAKKELGKDPYDYRDLSKEDRIAGKTERTHADMVGGGGGKVPSTAGDAGHAKCPMCSYELQGKWKFCPMCGVSFSKSK